MAFKAPGKLRIPQWSIVNRLITAEDITFDQHGAEVSRSRTDLTGGIVYLTVRDENGTVVMQKNSTDSSQIEHKNQLVAATIGQATVKFVYADTAPLSSDPKNKYWFDIWVMTADGREEPIVDRGRFYVDKSSTNISEGPAPSLPTYPASQTQQERSFRWEVPTDGDNFTVILPGVGMVDATYHVNATIAFLPVSGSYAICLIDETAQTSTTFNLKTSATVLAGTIFTFHTRDY